MSAAEVIALIDQLPLPEQQEVRVYMEKKEISAATGGVRRMDFAKGMAIGEGIFDRHPELFRKLAQ